MRTPRVFKILGFLTGITAGLATAAPPLPFVGPIEESPDRGRFVFEVSTPALLLSSTPDGSTSVRLEGFASRDESPGAPDLPRHVVRVAIPFGVVPRLEVTSLREDVLRGRVPRPVARDIAELGPDGNVERRRVFEPDAVLFGGIKRYPSDVAWIKGEGVYRDQRYVDVVLTPVRFDPSVRGLRVARTYRVAVVFDGTAAPTGKVETDPKLEDSYRSMFLNYAQGIGFRASPEPESSFVAPAMLVGPRYRIRVRANGIVRLDAARLAGTGFDTQPLASYKLTNRGVEVPLQVFDQDGDGNLDASDWVQFYGQALDDEPKAVPSPNVNPVAGIFEARDFTNENTYFLEVEAGSRSRLTARPSAPDNSAVATSFEAVAHAEVDDTWRPLSGNDPWYWKPLISLPLETGPPPAPVASRTQGVPLPGLASGTLPARVIVKLRGITEDGTTPADHKSQVTLKNASGQTLTSQTDDGTWDGRTVFTHDFTWTFPGSGNVLTQPAQVQIDPLSVSGAPLYKNQFYLDYIEVRYQRTFAATSDTLTFDFPDGSQEFQVTGLATNTPEVWEITGRVSATGVAAPVRLTGGVISGGAGNFSVRFHVAADPAIPDGAPRRFVVAGTNGIPVLPAADFTPDTISDLRNTSNQADLIVITHPTTVGAAATTTLNQLLAWKLANQGITSKVAAIQDVYDEFGDGNPGPLAIKNFLAYAMSSWANRKPAYVLLLGDGTYDYQHRDTSFPDGNFIPTQILYKDDPSFGYYASDSVLAAVSGSDLTPDLVVGRVSTRTDAETQAVLQKILTYEQSPPPGNWTRHAIFIADRGKNFDEDEEQQWRDTNSAGRNQMKIPPHTQRTMNYWGDYCGSTPAGCTQAKANLLRADIKSAVNGTDGFSDGAAMMQFTGHGSFKIWSDDVFFAQGFSGLFDVDALNNGARLPWLVVHNCLTGGFMDVDNVTLGEAWLKRAGGGALAVFAPSGLTDTYYGADITAQIFGDLYGPPKERLLGNAVADATNYVCIQGNAQTCQNYTLLGDPSVRMNLPTVAPPTNVTATGANLTVNLSWTASTTPGATYNIYRAEGSPTAGYT
ncbi:MAG TPA: C25 family cysteine peptidase, partial [Candidatus Polarisedimenticolaceae bacterium]|nr:C25 family cysteine peptidase [Candidatus Polarisedimenticolaceae bacterium]